MDNYLDGRTSRFCGYLHCYRIFVNKIESHWVEGCKRIYTNHIYFLNDYLILPEELKDSMELYNFYYVQVIEQQGYRILTCINASSWGIQ